MSLQNDIKKAYDNVHAPNDLTERLKQELYQKDFHDEAEELTCQVSEAPAYRPVQMFLQTFAFLAASLVLCAGCGLAVWSMRDKMDNFHPGSNVNVTSSSQETTEETTEPAE